MKDPNVYNKQHGIKSLVIRKISITDLDVDCIVNAANSQLQQGSGVCGAIFSAAGAKELQQACNQYGYCPTGEAVITPGFQLKAKYIVHAVGPRWQGGNHNEKQLLYNCYQNAMKLACSKGCRSIAFPLISSGIYGYPLHEAWQVAIHAIRHSPCEMDVMIAVIDDQAFALGNHILAYQFHASPASAKPSLVFFWREDGENGYLSQWYYAPFRVEGIQYLHAEQYMMAKKALLFHDTNTYSKIMTTSDPATGKALGRQVANFNQELWDSCKEEIVYHATYAKFSQNPKLKAALLATGDAIIAKASPSDRDWGIGLAANFPDAQNPDQWQGQNLLGKILMQVRAKLKQETAGK